MMRIKNSAFIMPSGEPKKNSNIVKHEEKKEEPVISVIPVLNVAAKPEVN